MLDYDSQLSPRRIQGYEHFYGSVGDVEALCYCHPRTEQSQRSVGRSFATAIGLAGGKPVVDDQQWFLGLERSRLVYATYGRDFQLRRKRWMELREVSVLHLESLGEWEHRVVFEHSDEVFDLMTCAYVLHGGNPEQAILVRMMERMIVAELRRAQLSR